MVAADVCYFRPYIVRLHQKSIWWIRKCDYGKRDPGKFTEVTADGPFIVYLQEAANTEVTINAEDNLMQFIETYVSGNTLHIKLKKNVQLHFIEDIKIYLKSPVYNAVNYSGNGFVQSIDTLHTDRFSCTING